MSGQSGGHQVYLSKLNEQLTCKLCGGYFIDATTIIECLHSFCRSCIVKYLQNNKYCPICEVQVHKSRPLLNIRPDHTLQDIVYKLVPGCYQNEMRCRREFYAKHPELSNQITSPEVHGEPIESHIYSPDESLSLSLEYFNPCTKDLNETNAIKDATQQPLLKRYLRCPAAVTVFHLQKLIRAKYGLSDAHRVDIMYKEEPLCSNYTLMDVMYIYHWRRKVPLHLSYRIFESSSKRIKLSEDNANYQKSLTNVGIHIVDETKDEQLSKREWKEVQLKISETGVMSITDISDTVPKRNTEIENIQDQKTSEETIASIVAMNKTVSLVENCDMSKSCVEVMQSTLIIDAQMTKNSVFPDSSNTSLITSDVKSIVENSSTNNCASLATQPDGSMITRQTGNETGNRTTPINLQQDTRETKSNNVGETNNVEDKVLQEQKSRISQHFTEENIPVADNTIGIDSHLTKLSMNNNNDSTDLKIEIQKECMKNTSEPKMENIGSKINALSVKLQFQPKMGQVNNTYSKKAPREKRTILQSIKKSEVKSSLENTKITDTKARTNSANITNKVSISYSTATSPQKSTVLTTVASQNTLTMLSSSESDKQETLCERGNFNTSINVQQALNLLEQKANSPMQTLEECTPKTGHIDNIVNQKLQCIRSNNAIVSDENVVSTVPNVHTSTMNQTISTFPYTVHDLVTNTALKPTLKNSNSSYVPQRVSGTLPVTCSMSNSQISSMPQFSVQTPSMNIYTIPASALKNNYNNANQGVTIVTATSTATITATATSKSMSMSTSTSTPTTCPDAIPISLMKSSMRKQEMTAKGSNLNEICAKIGSNTTGSKINDICAKIGENSKEKSKAEVRNKSDIPDLLKIAKKNSLPSLSNSDTMMKHIPNIPNVPVYTPSSNTTTTMENKNVKGVLLTSTTITSAISTSSVLTSHVAQRTPSSKKQNQPMGYKTLRDPPKSWNPTLSKNNYVAVKNQAKEMQNQIQTSTSEGTSKQIPSKPAKIFKVRNMPRYLGNPASGVKPMYGVTNDTKEKEQSTKNTKSTTLNMTKIDPKTLSPIVSTVNSPIVSPPPYSPNARSYQNTPFPRDICRNTGSPISPRNSPVNMLSTNPFIPSPTPNTNPRIIYSHFPPPFPDASRFPNPLIRSPINIPPPSAFHSSLPPSINKLYQRSSYIPQTTGYSPVASQPPTVQRIPPSTHSSSPKSPKVSSPTSISSTSFNIGKVESQSPITSTVDSVALLLPKNMPASIAMSPQREFNAFNLSKTGNLISATSNIQIKTSTVDTNDAIDAPSSKQNPSMSLNSTTTNVEISENMNPSSSAEQKQFKNANVQKTAESTHREENGQASKVKFTEMRRSAEITDNISPADKKEKNQATKVNGDVITEHFGNKKFKEDNSNEMITPIEIAERDEQVERSSLKERNNTSKSNVQANINDSTSANNSKNEDKTSEQVQGRKSEAQRNKAET